MLSPTLVVQPAAHAFGVVRASKKSELLVFLANHRSTRPWSLRHVPRLHRKPDEDNARPDSVDDPSVFTFEQWRPLPHRIGR